MHALKHLLLLVLLAVVVVPGCGKVQPRTVWQFTIKPEAGNTVIDTDGVTLVFEGVDSSPPNGHSMGGGGSIVVDGFGWHEVTVAVAKHPFTNVFSGGKNTMTFAGHTLLLQEGGSELHFGGAVFDLEAGKPRLVISTDGTIREEPTAPAASG